MIIEVKIWNEVIGFLEWDKDRFIARIELTDKKWRNLSPMKFKPRANNIYEFPELMRSETFKGLPGLFNESLPDRYGSALLTEYKKRVGITEFSPVVDLTYIGSRGMGALEYHPAITPNNLKSSYGIEIGAMRELAGKVLSEREGVDGSLTSKDALEELIEISTSAGGARAKAIIAVDKDRKNFRSGQVEAPEGYEYYLIKFDGENQKKLGDPEGLGLIEMAYYEMVKDCKIDMMPSEIYQEGGRQHFMTKRFDRLGKDKLHVQSLSSMCHYDFIGTTGANSYEQCFDVIRELDMDYNDKEQMFRRMSFNVLARNQDDHVKNISFGLEKGGKWKLNPAYDMVYNYNKEGRYTSKHQMTINGKRKVVEDKDLLVIAKNEGIKNPEKILKEMVEVVKAWPTYASAQKVSKSRMDEISSNLRVKVPGLKKSMKPKL